MKNNDYKEGPGKPGEGNNVQRSPDKNLGGHYKDGDTPKVQSGVKFFQEQDVVVKNADVNKPNGPERRSTADYR